MERKVLCEEGKEGKAMGWAGDGLRSRVHLPRGNRGEPTPVGAKKWPVATNPIQWQPTVTCTPATRSR